MARTFSQFSNHPMRLAFFVFLKIFDVNIKDGTLICKNCWQGSFFNESLDCNYIAKSNLDSTIQPFNNNVVLNETKNPCDKLIDVMIPQQKKLRLFKDIVLDGLIKVKYQKE